MKRVLRQQTTARALALATTALMMVVTRRSLAAESAHLVYERPGDAVACPDEWALRRSVVARLGYDPFSAGAPRTIIVRLRRDATGHRGIVRVVDDSVPPRAERTIFTAGECGELVESLALTISVALDPMAALRPEALATGVEVDDSRVPTPLTPRVTQEATTASVRSPLVLSLGVGPILSSGDAPAPVAGALVYFAARRGVLGGVLEANASLEGSAPTAFGRVSSWSASALAGVCAHVSVLFGCAVGTIGVLSADADVAVRRRDTALLSMVGPRVGVAVTLGRPWLEFRGHVEGLLSLTRHRLAISEQDVYEFAPGKLGLAAALGARF